MDGEMTWVPVVVTWRVLTRCLVPEGVVPADWIERAPLEHVALSLDPDEQPGGEAELVDAWVRK